VFFHDDEQRGSKEVPLNIGEFPETLRAALFGTAYAHFFSGLPPDYRPQSRAVIDRAKVAQSDRRESPEIGFTTTPGGIWRHEGGCGRSVRSFRPTALPKAA
jgi:hypothetical protein